jgi:transposase, IS30 family
MNKITNFKTKRYLGLSCSERSEIQMLRSKKYSIRSIASVLGRSPNTVSREIKTNSVRSELTGELEYIAIKAKDKSRLSRKSRRFQWQKIEYHPKLHAFIIEMLAPPNDWSPDIISGHLRLQSELPYVSTPSIYEWLYSSRGQPYCQHLCTKRYKPKHRKDNKTDRVMIPERTSVSERPEAATNRVEIGHMEYDSIVSSKRCGSTYALAVLQDRTSRLVRAVLVPNLRPSDFAQAITGMAKGLKVVTLTTDNGIENKQHRLITQALSGNPKVYFTDPYSSWQKGGVENVNRMIRRYFPKGTNFANVAQAQIDQALWTINNKPRRCLGYKSAVQYAVEKGLLLEGGVLVMG